MLTMERAYSDGPSPRRHDEDPGITNNNWKVVSSLNLPASRPIFFPLYARLGSASISFRNRLAQYQFLRIYTISTRYRDLRVVYRDTGLSVKTHHYQHSRLSWPPLQQHHRMCRIERIVATHPDNHCRINVNDPGLITLVNKLQDVFTTVGV